MTDGRARRSDPDPVLRARTQPWVEAALAPVLLAQGRAVRRNTPRLPEPEGPRAGGRGPLGLLVVGDSSAAGVGGTRWEETLTARLVERLGGPAQVRWRLVARTGWTTPEATRALEGSERARFQVAVTALGVNDVTARTPFAQASRDHRALLLRLVERFGVERIVVSALPPMRSFPALPWPLRAVLGRRGDALDACLERVEAAFPQVTRVRPVAQEPAARTAADGFHPGPEAYAVWAERVLAALGPLTGDGTR